VLVTYGNGECVKFISRRDGYDGLSRVLLGVARVALGVRWYSQI